MLDTHPDHPIMIMTNCESVNQAKRIGKEIIDQRIAACFNIIPHITSMYFWPPQSDMYEENSEATLIIKTFASYYARVESEIIKHHPYITPFVCAIKYEHVSEKYVEWMRGEIREIKA